MSNQIHINDKIDSLNEQADQILERAKLLKAQAKLAQQVKEQFPNAHYAVQPNTISGYVDRSINGQTHGAIKRHTFNRDEKKFGYYYELTVKLGKQRLVMTSEIQGWLNNRDIEIILDASCIQKSRKAKPVETEVIPTVRNS
ncbi:MAG TPA: hypothetical protein VM577_00715 [Anaerovoracaceae bacterium]|nr:hypothetical protein [Anaerovoracaceae bacterium]